MHIYIENFITYLKYNKGYSIYTLENYKMDLLLFLEYMKTVHIEDIKKITYNILRGYLEYLYDKKYSSASINRHISSLKSFFHYLMREGIIKENPAVLISSVKKEKKLPKYIGYNAIETILLLPDIKSPLGKRDSAILEVLYSCGVRVSELVSIKLKDIEFFENRIKVLGKGNKERYVLFGKIAKEKLQLYIEEGRDSILNGKNTSYLFINNNGQKLTTSGVRYIINQTLKKAGEKMHVTPHMLRHTFATHMLNEGADLKSVQELLGHENMSTTQIYTYVSNEKMRAVYLKSHPRAHDKV